MYLFIKIRRPTHLNIFTSIGFIGGGGGALWLNFPYRIVLQNWSFTLSASCYIYFNRKKTVFKWKNTLCDVPKAVFVDVLGTFAVLFSWRQWMNEIMSPVPKWGQMITENLNIFCCLITEWVNKTCLIEMYRSFWSLLAKLLLIQSVGYTGSLLFRSF